MVDKLKLLRHLVGPNFKLSPTMVDKLKHFKTFDSHKLFFPFDLFLNGSDLVLKILPEKPGKVTEISMFLSPNNPECVIPEVYVMVETLF